MAGGGDTCRLQLSRSPSERGLISAPVFTQIAVEGKEKARKARKEASIFGRERPHLFFPPRWKVLGGP